MKMHDNDTPEENATPKNCNSWGKGNLDIDNVSLE